MRIGLDFDNTIVCYDQAIALLAEELLKLPKGVQYTKPALREFLRVAGREPEWTSFQGELYGPGMRFARPFEGAISTIQDLVDQGHELVIVSHRTRKPYSGRSHDLHAAARHWINEHLQSVGLFNSEDSAINFVETREKKVERISELGCRTFLDDLPEMLGMTGFPEKTLGILFDPCMSKIAPAGCRRITAWQELSGVVKELKE